MPTYWQLLLLVLPVFVLIAIGVVARRVHWIEGDGETSLIRFAVNVCFPCLIFESVSGNAALREPANLLVPPLVGFGLAWISLQSGKIMAKGIGLHVGSGLRTFALAVGINNYGFLPLPIMVSIWGEQSRGVLWVHNIGVEIAVWTVGVLILSGLSFREGWRKIVSPITITIVVAAALNLAGLSGHVPKVLTDSIHALAVCSVPLGLIMTGVSLAGFVSEPRQLFDRKVSTASIALRLGILPVIYLLVAKYGPFSIDLKRVLVVQAAMPTAMTSVILARLYGGHPRTAVQIVIGTTVTGLFLIPLWLRAGLAWVGV
jgi:malate permease and related proteins